MTTINSLTTEQTTLLTDDSFALQTAAGVTKRVKATNLKLVGYEDVLFIPTEVPSGSAAPNITIFRGGIAFPAFGTSVVQEVYGSIHLPHSYVAGTDIYFHVHWSHIAAAPTGNANWKFEYTIARGFGFETFPAPTTIDLTQTAAAQYTHHLIESGAISGTNLEADTLIIGRLYRDPADVLDTFNDNIYLLRADAHIQSDSRATKEKARPFTKV